jgi:twitching motility protein PilT
MEGKPTIQEILLEGVNREASDVHIKAGVPPFFRINRELHTASEFGVITDEDAKNFLHGITSVEQKSSFYQERELDFSYDPPGIGRFRVNAYFQLSSISIAFRWVRTEIPTLEKLGLPLICQDLSLKRDGMVILTGPTGCGKSTTLAAMLGYMNGIVKRNIITIEDPVEYLHKDDKCTFSQREVGVDTHTFAAALKRVLRQDPDVILIGEMRDPETMSIALTAAETGHLVLTTLHTPSASEAVDRFVDAFPPYQHQQVRLQLSTTLEAILYQSLIPKADGTGVIPAVEILIATPAIRNLIREAKTYQMQNFMHTGQDVGMKTLDQALTELHQRGLISREEAYSRLRGRENIGAQGNLKRS